ncbi:MAG: uracil-DNA glycosylase [Helicobacter sp.]|nr:uracil-DNA glycosylase [Helicobacter sp.]
MEFQLTPSWREFLGSKMQDPRILKLQENYFRALQKEVVYPPKHLLFNALDLISPDKIKIIILGQDPYIGSERINGIKTPQAMGLSFSVARNFKVPASLANIYEELRRTRNFTIPNHGDLSAWAQRGALLLNSILSVKEGESRSHASFGWEFLSDFIISKISQEFSGLYFLLFGNFARKKQSLINPKKHIILQAPHPSPLAARSGFSFIGSGVFKDVDFDFRL